MRPVEPKVIIVGVGNSGTSLLGTLVHELLLPLGYPLYYYEPLYWAGTEGEKNITLNPDGIREHTQFPLLPDESIQLWPWLERFMHGFTGLAKFIRLGSRIRLAVQYPVKIIWITRELYSYLGSMQKNFPRCLPGRGWHHRPGEYDDFVRLRQLYPDYDLRPEEEYRIEVEAAWWHLHNSQMMKYFNPAMYHIRYENFSREPVRFMKEIARFIGAPFLRSETIDRIYPVPNRPLALSSRNRQVINAIAGSLNRTIYAGSNAVQPEDDQ